MRTKAARALVEDKRNCNWSREQKIQHPEAGFSVQKLCTR